MGRGVLWSWLLFAVRTVLNADGSSSDWVKEAPYFAPISFASSQIFEDDTILGLLSLVSACIARG